MAFLSEDSWKTGLSPQQLNKIALLEKHRDGLKNELAKKSYNHDIVQQGFDKEKRKVEEERSKVASVLREKQELHEKWVEIERKLEKNQHEFSVKEAQNRAMQGQMEMKVRQLEEARCTKQPPGAPSTGVMTGRRSLPSTPSEDLNTWNKFNMTKELEEARKQLKLRDQEIPQLRAQVQLVSPLQSPHQPTHLASPVQSVQSSLSPQNQQTPLVTSPEMEAKLFKSSLQIAERSKTSSISFVENKQLKNVAPIMKRPSHLQVVPDHEASHLRELLRVKDQELKDLQAKHAEALEELAGNIHGTDENQNHHKVVTPGYESERKNSNNNNTTANKLNMALEKLKFELEEEKAQKSFYQDRHKEATVELQNKAKDGEEAKKKIISLENESMAKQSELKRVKNELEEKDNDIGSLGYDKDTLRNQVKEMQNQMDNFKSKVGNLESLLTSKDAKIQELKDQIDEQKQEMNHSSSHNSSLGGQVTTLRDEKTSLNKNVLNANKAKREIEAKLEERNSFIEELQARMDAKQKEASNAALKWQKELEDSNAKIKELTNKGKSLNEQLVLNRKESQEVLQSKTSDNQKAQDVKVEKQSLEVELATLKEKFERESERRQTALKDYKELEKKMTEVKTQLKLRESKLKQTEEENRTLNQAWDSAKIDLSQNQDKWDTEKTKILHQHNTKVQKKETEVEKMRELQSDLESVKYDLEKERAALIELSDKLDAKEVASEKLEGIVKQLQTNMATELATKKSLVAELDDAKTSMATNTNTTNDLKSEKDDLQIEVQNLRDKLHQFRKQSKESEMDIQKTNESITLIEDKTKTLEEKLRNSETACEDWQDKFKESQETIYQHSKELKTTQKEKSTMETNLTEVTLALDSLRLEKDSLVLDLFEQTKYKDEVEILRKEKERLSEKSDALWKEVKDHQDLVHATEKEHLDLRRELEAQIRDKDENCRKLQAQLTQLKSTSGDIIDENGTKNTFSSDTELMTDNEQSLSTSSVNETITKIPVSPATSLKISSKSKENSKVPRKKVPVASKKSIEEKNR